MKKLNYLTLSLLACSVQQALAADYFWQSPAGSSQMAQGGTGLIQMPTARHSTEGDFYLNYSDSQEYRFWSASLQLYPWLETTIRYTDVRTQLYSEDPSFSGNQTYKDKGIDVKLRLWQESLYVPELSVGVRDFGGTGLFESEFIAASKRFGPVDLHLGLGWGYLGRRDNISNPFCDLNDRFCDRPGGVSGSGGKVEYKKFFRGPTSLYAGIEYQTPWAPLRLKAEYDGNTYLQDFAGALAQDSDFNFAAVYALNDAFDLTVNYQRGNTFGFGVSYKLNFNSISQVKLDLPPPEVSEKRAVDRIELIDKAALASDLYHHAGFVVNNYKLTDDELVLTGRQVAYRHEDVAMERVGRVLAKYLPGSVKSYRIVIESARLPVVETHIDAEQFIAASTAQQPGLKVTDSFTRENPQPHQWQTEQDYTGLGLGSNFFWIQSFGNPESFYMYQAGLLANASYKLTPNFGVFGTAKINLLTNFDHFNYKVDSFDTGVPRVRTYVREYVTRSDVTMENLFTQWADELSPDWYGQLYAGYLETMFGGVGGEVLYRPVDSSLAFGLDLNYVKQRSYEKELAFFDYKTVTGHLSAYWQPQYSWLKDSLVTVSVGQYLAKDKGVTLEFARRFDSGIIVGAYGAFTDMSAEQYGEGSFTKGFYVSIPFDLFSLKSSTGRGRLPWVPISRDGGQALHRPVRLMDITEARAPFYR
ncbi:YjbH domain-containing protein [Rheinheimera sp.]|uniref:YjbH domain-containing protein n=1 Tax=Rheinheimera sp. TaxID=1869214 RepID=UPI00307CE8A8